MKEYFYQEDDVLRRPKIPNNVNNKLTLAFGNAELPLHPQVAGYVDWLHGLGWRFFIVNPTRNSGTSWAEWNVERGTKLICISTEVLRAKKPNWWDYFNYVVAHECAHAKNWEDGLTNEHHGQKFMAALIAICPNEWLHYEIGYKPRNAASAGITENGYVKPLPKKLTLDDL